MEITEKRKLYRQLPARICAWYEKNRRILPWREDRDPYKVWVSEIMLQQTRVEAVKPYYARFIKELPDVESLAACPEERLLKLWEGLGYYSRVRNMQKAARQMVGMKEESQQEADSQSDGIEKESQKEADRQSIGIEKESQQETDRQSIGIEKESQREADSQSAGIEKESQREADSQSAGIEKESQKEADSQSVRTEKKLQENLPPDNSCRLPRDLKELQKLPGIGSYTAGAIASIAYGVPVPAVDGNVLRILARLTADDTDVLKVSVKREAEQLLTEALQGGYDPGEFNQGLMDLGAGICLPNAKPICEECPLADICESHRTGQETSYPIRKKAKERRVEQRTILVIRDGERVALTRRKDTGLLAGMFEFPNLPGKLNRKTVLEVVAKNGLDPLHIQKLEPVKHLFSHVEWQMAGYEIRVAGFPEEKTGVWFLAEVGQIEKEYPIPSAYKAYAKHLRMSIGSPGEPRA